jgi:NADH:ubiquinone oxidoreductase, NADH-binding (51 kD) subunit
MKRLSDIVKEDFLEKASVQNGTPYLIGPDSVLIRQAILDGGPGLSTYLKDGGYEGLRRVLGNLSPSEAIEELKEAGLRGRGGSGFPTAIKWEKVANHRIREKYVVANGSEGEPGSHKDHFLIETNPHQILEGMIIASFAVQARKAILFVKDSFPRGIDALKKAKG